MTVLKYSRQRESIKSYLNKSYEHPTADMVYFHVKQDFPNISLGTVYRNLNLLADLGEAIKITGPDGVVHFDGRTNPHYHVCCNTCGKVIDLEMKEPECILDAAAENFDGMIEGHSIMFYGTCSDCMKKSESSG